MPAGDEKVSHKLLILAPSGVFLVHRMCVQGKSRVWCVSRILNVQKPDTANVVQVLLIEIRDDVSLCFLFATDPGSSVKVYTDTIEGEPQVETDVMEVEETLPDGTVVKRKVIKTRQKQTIVKRVVMEGPEGDLPLGAGETEQTVAVPGPGHMDPQMQMQMYADRIAAEPLQSTDVHVYEETLPDGTVRKKRIVTRTEQAQHTERRVLEGPAAAQAGAAVVLGLSPADSDANISTPGDHPQIAPLSPTEGTVSTHRTPLVCCCESSVHGVTVWTPEIFTAP